LHQGLNAGFQRAPDATPRLFFGKKYCKASPSITGHQVLLLPDSLATLGPGAEKSARASSMPDGGAQRVALPGSERLPCTRF
jgi:hypothetical protein